MVDQIRENLRANLARVERLVVTYETHPEAQGQGRKRAELLDILRAAIVLLHASLEDVLRSAARWKLPLAPGAALNGIPLAGHESVRKFLLGDLAPFRGKTVDDIFRESIEAHLEHSNYNNTNEISALLNEIGVDPTHVNGNFTELQQLMLRRHQIVHRADRQGTSRGRGNHRVRAINRETVRAWRDAVRVFCDRLFTELEA